MLKLADYPKAHIDIEAIIQFKKDIILEGETKKVEVSCHPTALPE